MGRIIMEKEDIKKFVEDQLESMDYADDFFVLDSLQKLELIMKCEQEYLISINEEDIDEDFETDMFVDFIYDKINTKN
jgi:acyl carrier protein